MSLPWAFALPLLLPWVAGGLGNAASTRDHVLLAPVLQPGVCRYGAKLGCCYGWKRNSNGVCEATCEPGCKFGECVGPNRCRCFPGYTGKTCSQDVNECGEKPRPCQHRCMNTHGSYKCFCLSGHMLMPNATCANSRTCAMTNCQYNCEDTEKGPRCLCPSSGLHLAPNGRACIDIDECASGRTVCPYNRRCVNTFGSYYCKCHVGFELKYISGRYDCIDINECAVNTHTCNLYANCLNTQGSFKCKCKQGYKGSGLQCSDWVSQMMVKELSRSRDESIAKKNKNLDTSVEPPGQTSALENTCVKAEILEDPRKSIILDSIPNLVGAVIPEKSVKEVLRVPGTINDRIKKLLAHKNSMKKKVKIKNIIREPAGTPTPKGNSLPFDSEDSVSRDENQNVGGKGNEEINEEVLEEENRDKSVLKNHVEQEQGLRGDVFSPKVNEASEFGLVLVKRKAIASKLEYKDLNISVDCSFSHGVCAWKQDVEDDFDWSPTDGDNAVGYYMGVPALAGHEKDIGRLKLLLPNLQPQSNFCLLFHYRLAGDKVGKLRVFVKNSTSTLALEETKSEDGRWKMGQIQLPQGTDTTKKVIFEAERGKGRTGEIGVDSVLLVSGLCPDGLLSVNA